MQRRQLDDHVRDMCRQRLIRCQYCHMDFKFTDIDQHVQEGCTHFPVNCENDDCTVVVVREKMEEHLLQCLFTPVPCIYADIGCMHKCPREKVNNHMETSRDSHLKHATRKIKTLEQTVEIQQEKLQQLGIQVKELKDEFKRDRELHIREMQKQKEFNTHLEEEKDDLVRQIYEIAEKHNKQEKEEQIRIAHFNNQDFIWKIADYRHKPKNSPWPSEEFYIRGYKIKLYATINIGNELLVSIELLKGEFDDRLPWPFKHIITLSVLDNDGDSPFKGKTINPPKDCHGRFFQKPARESNERTGPFSVLSLNKTKGKHSIKESILLRFSVSQ